MSTSLFSLLLLDITHDEFFWFGKNGNKHCPNENDKGNDNGTLNIQPGIPFVNFKPNTTASLQKWLLLRCTKSYEFSEYSPLLLSCTFEHHFSNSYLCTVVWPIDIICIGVKPVLLRNCSGLSLDITLL